MINTLNNKSPSNKNSLELSSTMFFVLKLILRKSPCRAEPVGKDFQFKTMLKMYFATNANKIQLVFGRYKNNCVYFHNFNLYLGTHIFNATFIKTKHK